MHNPYPNRNAMESKKTKQNSIVWEWNVAQPAQGNGDGQAADKPVGGLRMTPNSKQKQLKGKTVKLIMTGSIKRALAVHSGRQTQEITERNKQERKKQKYKKEKR